MTLSGRPDAISYQWNNGTTSQTIMTTTSGIYWVVSQFPCNMIVDTFHVTHQLDTIKGVFTNVICNSIPVQLSGRNGADTYLWSNGNNTQQQTANVPGQYWVRSVFECEVYIDTFYVSAVDLYPDLGNDTIICNGASMTLSAGVVNGATYVWQDGTTTNTHVVNDEGTYIVTVSKSGCVAKDTVNIEVQTVSLSLEDRTICKGDTVVVDISQPGANYLWQNGDTDPVFIATEEGIYNATITINGCSATDAFSLTHRRFPDLNIIDDDRVYCRGDQVTLRAIDAQEHTYIWQDSTLGPELQVNKEGMYIVTIINDCRRYNDSTYVHYKQCDCIHYMPNVFTPNSDSKNNKIGVIIDCPATDTELAIYDRYGNRVFYTKDLSEKWDGTYLGASSDVGTYYFYYKFKSPRGEKVMNKGDIHLLK